MREVALAVSRGYSDKDIAAALGISTHILGLDGFWQFVSYAHAPPPALPALASRARMWLWAGRGEAASVIGAAVQFQAGGRWSRSR